MSTKPKKSQQKQKHKARALLHENLDPKIGVIEVTTGSKGLMIGLSRAVAENLWRRMIAENSLAAFTEFITNPKTKRKIVAATVKKRGRWYVGDVA